MSRAGSLAASQNLAAAVHAAAAEERSPPEQVLAGNEEIVLHRGHALTGTGYCTRHRPPPTPRLHSLYVYISISVEMLFRHRYKIPRHDAPCWRCIGPGERDRGSIIHQISETMLKPELPGPRPRLRLACGWTLCCQGQFDRKLLVLTLL